MRRVFIGGDHVSVQLKEATIKYLKQQDIEVIDLGTDSGDVSVDYNVFAQKVARAVVESENDRGIVLCGSGIGASIAANKVKGARAALCHNAFTAHLARAHNDANILAMGAWVVSPEQMPEIVTEWLNTPFEGGRHIPRIQMLDKFIPDAVLPDPPGFDPNVFQYALSLSTHETIFGPVLFAGKIEKGFAELQECGFHHVELSVRNVNDLLFKELETLLHRYDLNITAFATGQGCLHDQLCLNAADPNLRSAAVKRMMEIIDLAHQFDADVIIGGVRGKFGGSHENQAKQHSGLLESIQSCCEHAKKQGVTLLLETINRYETNCINSTSQALDFIQELGKPPNLKILLDTFHMNIEEADLHETIRTVGEHLGYVHLADSNRLAPGQGHTDLRSIMHTLFEIGYRGVISAEILPLPNDAGAIQQTAKFLKACGVVM